MCLSPIGADFSQIISALFSDGTASPVRDDSSDLRDASDIILASQQRISPVSSTRISPGTTSSDKILFSLPSRITFACGADNLLSASIAFSARFS